MTKILFVCHGNICRSPMAEFIFRNMVQKAGLEGRYYVASAATSTEEIWNGVGNPVYPPARDELAKHGISCAGKRAVQLTRSDYEKYDFLIGMDEMNIRNMERMTGHRRGEKIFKLLEFAGRSQDVADPWYTGDFRRTYEDVADGCEGLLRYLEDRIHQQKETMQYERPGKGTHGCEERAMTQAVLFDMDGTLIDTEKYYRIFWPKALAEFGYTMTEEQVLAMRSLGRPFAPAQLKAWFGEELDYYAVRDRRKALMEEVLDREGIVLKPGAVEILVELKRRGILAAVATATDLERTEKYLKMTGIRQYFDCIISATQVKEGKPSPDIYRFACEQLGLSPDQCIAVEDSPNGVLSAYRAGCRVVMVPDQTQPDAELSKCLYACVPSLDRLADFLD